MNAWSELPNAKHIDWVLNSLEFNPDIWIEARKQALDQAWKQARIQAWDQARKQAWSQAWSQAWDQAWNQARHQAWNQAWNQAYDQARDQAWYETRDQVNGVLLALVAYDDCDQYLAMTFDELKTWALVSEKPQAILLLPMVYVKEQINECLV